MTDILCCTIMIYVCQGLSVLALMKIKYLIAFHLFHFKALKFLEKQQPGETHWLPNFHVMKMLDPENFLTVFSFVLLFTILICLES